MRRPIRWTLPRQQRTEAFHALRTLITAECCNNLRQLGSLDYYTSRQHVTTISHDLSWTSHVVEVVNKTNKVLGLIKRTIGSVNKEIFSTLYKALVGPILEYASPARCPYLVKNIVLLEKVRRRASRLALGQRRGEMSYEDRCKLLRWSQLTDKRLYFSLIECYKLVFGLNSLCCRDFFEFASKRTRSNHNYKLQVKSANCNCYTIMKYSFFVKIIREWNDLRMLYKRSWRIPILWRTVLCDRKNAKLSRQYLQFSSVEYLHSGNFLSGAKKHKFAKCDETTFTTRIFLAFGRFLWSKFKKFLPKAMEKKLK